jgi:integrase
MATYRITVIKKDKKSDNTWNVKVRITHKRKMGYIGTEYYVPRSALNNKFEVINSSVNQAVEPIIRKYRRLELELGESLDKLNVKQLTEYLKKDRGLEIDFLHCFDEFTKNMIKLGRKKTFANYNTTKNHLIAYMGSKNLPISFVTSSFLTDLELWLRSHEEIDAKTKKRLTKVCGDTAIGNYMRCIRAVFNDARKRYNNDDIGDIRIKHYPFARYEIPEPDKAENRNLEIDIIRKLRDKELTLSRDILGRDVFMISFYLMGMNTIDLYYCPPEENGRIAYKRSKTKKKRKDNAEISVKLQPELLPYLEKYKGTNTAFNFCDRFSSAENFNKSVDKGLKRVGEAMGLPRSLGSYYARHSWATIAANDCRIDETIVKKALNHSDPSLKITRIYIKKDWTIIDEANRKVLDLLKCEDDSGEE